MKKTPSPFSSVRAIAIPGAMILAAASLALAGAGSGARAAAGSQAVATAAQYAQLPNPNAPKRVIYYYQTQYYNGNYVSLAPIWQQINPRTGKPIVTDVIVASFHFGYNTDGTPYIHLNDNIPQDPMFDQMWQEVSTLQSYGVTVQILLGGAAQGSYNDLFTQWSTFYPLLKQTLNQYHLNGFDMDIEENVTLAHAQQLIDALNRDYGPHFILTMDPVASALFGGANLSGFSYKQLYQSKEGQRINWFNGQFYNGFASMASTSDYDRVVAYGFPANKVVAGTLGNPGDGSEFVPIATVANTVTSLVGEYSNFGGAAEWEYFNALPGGLSDPTQWAAIMGRALGQ